LSVRKPGSFEPAVVELTVLEIQEKAPNIFKPAVGKDTVLEQKALECAMKALVLEAALINAVMIAGHVVPLARKLFRSDHFQHLDQPLLIIKYDFFFLHSN
jgi:hypothetical protein